MHEHKMPTPYIIEGVYPAPGETVHKAIFRAHKKALKFAMESNVFRYNDIIILEEDCRFIQQDAFSMICNARDSLSNWNSIHIGHIPLGPIFPTHIKKLFYSIIPMTAHCIVWNRKILPTVVSYCDIYDRPYIIEGNLSLPLLQNFAFVPGLAIQSKPPKEISLLPFGLNTLTYTEAEYGTVYALHTILILLFYFIVQNLQSYMKL